MAKIYAIGFKHWVELRAYDKPPKPEIDEVGGKTTEKKVVSYTYSGMPVYKDVEVPWVIKTVHYPRGKVVYTLKSGRLKYLGISVRDQECKELVGEELKSLASRDEFSKLRKYL
jgi:hypothetical protein